MRLYKLVFLVTVFDPRDPARNAFLANASIRPSSSLQLFSEHSP
jgi:hypothetical protein